MAGSLSASFGLAARFRGNPPAMIPVVASKEGEPGFLQTGPIPSPIRAFVAAASRQPEPPATNQNVGSSNLSGRVTHSCLIFSTTSNKTLLSFWNLSLAAYPRSRRRNCPATPFLTS